MLESNEGLLAKWYNVWMFVVVFASITPLIFYEEYAWFDVVETITVTLFIVDYLLRWYIADKIINKGPWSYFIYIFHPMAIIDLLSILPAIQLISPAFKALRCLRMFKLFRVFKLLRLCRSIVLFLNILHKERHILCSVLVIATIYIFMTALLIYNVEPHIHPKTGEVLFDSFLDALYWATVTLTTVGYGDLCPVTSIGRCLSMFTALFGMAIIALPSGIITASYLNELKKRERQD